MNEDVKAVVEGSAFITLVTIKADGTPHPIIAGKGQVDGDNILFGIYKMEQTQKNIAADSRAWLVACTMGDGPKGFRLAGTASVNDKQLVFTPTSSESLM